MIYLLYRIVEKLFLKFTSTSELIAVDSVQGGTITELTYSIAMKKPNYVERFMKEIKNINEDHKVTLVTGYNGTDL